VNRQDLYNGIKILGGMATFKVSEDDMLAYVEGELVEFSDEICARLPDLIEEAGIVFGLSKVLEAIEDRLIVARGDPPEDGKDGVIKIAVEPLASALDSDEDMEDARDFKSLNLIPNVLMGEVVAKRIPPTPGRPGTNIFGEKMEPRPGELVAFKLGANVEIVDKDTLVASCDGAVKIEDDGTMSVATEWIIDGDVDIATGHVEFAGSSLTVKGSVCSGFSVEAANDLLIEGSVNDDTIVLAGGHIEVEGIIRSRNTILKAGRGLTCKAIEYAKVFSSGDVKVEDYILDANCQVEGSMEVITGKGLIAGGRIELGGSLIANIIGTAANVPTIIAAGINPLLERHYEALVKEQEKSARKLAEIKKGMLKLDRLESAQGGLDPKMEGIKKRLLDVAMSIVSSMEENKLKIRELETNMGQMEKASITILKKAYPNCKIRIDKASKVIDSQMESVCFTFRKGEIVTRYIASKGKESS